MPGFDRTGPLGRGSRTGGGFGYCGPNIPADASVGSGFAGRFGRGYQKWRAFGGGFGWGRGSRFWGQNYGPPDEPQASRKKVRDDLKAQISRLKAEIGVLQDRLTVLDVNGSGKADN